MMENHTNCTDCDIYGIELYYSMHILYEYDICWWKIHPVFCFALYSCCIFLILRGIFVLFLYKGSFLFKL